MNLNVFLLMQKGQEGSDRHEEFFDIFPIQIGMGDYHARIIVHPIGWNLDFCLEESVALSDSQVSDPVSIATGSIVIHGAKVPDVTARLEVEAAGVVAAGEEA